KIDPLMWQVFQALVEHTVNTDLGDGFALKDLQPTQVLKEMPFYMALNEANTLELNDLVQSRMPDLPYQPLGYRDLVGHMNGFVDLIAEHQGRYYVMDYKSNDLSGDYSQAHLYRKMQQANYGLQGVIYTLALHRYLRHRMADYDYDRHFGGVRYLFVRGMRAQAPEEGVYAFRPARALIEQLDTLLSGGTL
ncbi:MAG: PD-(D/E)XK nuclease family protein, partial [Hydrogenovibrio sp.]